MRSRRLALGLGELITAQAAVRWLFVNAATRGFANLPSGLPSKIVLVLPFEHLLCRHRPLGWLS